VSARLLDLAGRSPTWIKSKQEQRGADVMALTRLAVDESPHNSDGLVLYAWDGAERIMAFIGRRVMEIWVDPVEPCGGRKFLRRAQYNELGKRNIAAIERIAATKYDRGPAFNRQHPFVDILYADIAESGEVLDLGQLAH
jgi:hypothetical protein